MLVSKLVVEKVLQHFISLLVDGQRSVSNNFLYFTQPGSHGSLQEEGGKVIPILCVWHCCTLGTGHLAVATCLGEPKLRLRTCLCFLEAKGFGPMEQYTVHEHQHLNKVWYGL